MVEEIDVFSDMWRNPPKKDRCKAEIGCRFPDGTIGNLDEFEKRYKDDLVGKTWAEINNYIKDTDVGILVTCEDGQTFVETTDIVEKKLDDLKNRVDILEAREED